MYIILQPAECSVHNREELRSFQMILNLYNLERENFDAEQRAAHV
jgi:hypothetical protein